MPCSHSFQSQSRRTSCLLFQKTRTITNPWERSLDMFPLSSALDAEGGHHKLLDRILGDSLAPLLYHLWTLTQLILIASQHLHRLLCLFHQHRHCRHLRRNIMEDHLQRYLSKNLARMTFLLSLFPFHRYSHRMHLTRREHHSKGTTSITLRHTSNHTTNHRLSPILNRRHPLSIRLQGLFPSLDRFHSILC